MNSPSSESEFYSNIARVAVAQICGSVGYKAAQSCALETLSDIAGRYLWAIANSAAASANSGGRTECNLVDISVALEDLSSVQGFIGAHELEESHCFISSSVLKDIMKFVPWKDEIPFAQPIPKKICPEWKKSGNEMSLRHVPRWLPEMPVMNGIAMGKGNEGNGEEKPGVVVVDQESMLPNVANEKGIGFELPEKRGKVKFKMGMGRLGGALGGGAGNVRGSGIGMEMRNNGVFSRSGNGKRILCQGWSDGDGNEE